MRPISEYVKEILAEHPDAPVVIVNGGVVQSIHNIKEGQSVFVLDIDEDAVVREDGAIVTRFTREDKNG